MKKSCYLIVFSQLGPRNSALEISIGSQYLVCSQLGPRHSALETSIGSQYCMSFFLRHAFESQAPWIAGLPCPAGRTCSTSYESPGIGQSLWRCEGGGELLSLHFSPFSASIHNILIGMELIVAFDCILSPILAKFESFTVRSGFMVRSGFKL